MSDMTTVSISQDTREELIRVQGKRQMDTGLAMTFEDVIGWLAMKEIDSWRKS